jgi:hypothetical protein
VGSRCRDRFRLGILCKFLNQNQQPKPTHPQPPFHSRSLSSPLTLQAWRHCGALADAQEAVDELDYLLGVLQPYEALFCLDVVERSVRDMLTTVPWQQADAVDVLFWKELPLYQPHVSTNVQYDENDRDSGDNYILDEAYVKALFELRVD